MVPLPSAASRVGYCLPYGRFDGMQAFEMRVRPALDSLDNGLDRVKLFIYQKFADYGLPCPVTGSRGHIFFRDP